MPPTTFFTASAWCGIAASACMIVPAAVEAFTGETAPTSLALAASAALAAPLLVGLYQKQAERAGRFGAIAAVLNFVGLALFGAAAFAINAILFFLGEDAAPPQARLSLLAAVLVFTIGAIAFSVSMVRARIFPRVVAIAYAITLPGLAFASRLPETLLVTAIHVLAGATVLWLSLALIASTRTAAGAGETATR